MKKYKNKYRIPSRRLQSWDYGNNGFYFITICTGDKLHYFGKIINKRLEASEIGELAANYWLQIPNHFPYVELGSFVIMPNHVHGILIINKVETVETRFIASLLPQPAQKKGGVCGNKNPMIQENIARAVRWYKGRCTFEFRKINKDFNWQSRFHDHIIRDARAFENIQNYIEKNPENWDKDKFF